MPVQPPRHTWYLDQYYDAISYDNYMTSLLFRPFAQYIQDRITAAYNHNLASAKRDWIFAMELQNMVLNTGSEWLLLSTGDYSNDLLAEPLQNCILVGLTKDQEETITLISDKREQIQFLMPIRLLKARGL